SLASRYDVQQFVEKVQNVPPLSSLTGGLHLHNLRCPSEEAYQRVCDELESLGILYTEGKND
ncbi:MAG: transcription repressor NadR, partial [Ruminiclostridium sp.]|nr:transcription repressor NadR [Ruminiclostridium sp.]